MTQPTVDDKAVLETPGLRDEEPQKDQKEATRPPDEPQHLRCKQRHANLLIIEWQVSDTAEAFFESCEVEVSGWTWYPATFAADGEPTLVGDNCWSATISHLMSETLYDVRVRGRNDLGDGPWAMDSFQTSVRPPKPFAVSEVHRGLNDFVLEWTAPGTDGAEIIACYAQVAGSLSWSDAIYRLGEEPRRINEDVWCTTISGLAPCQTYDTRLASVNAAGVSDWSKPQRFATTGPPLVPFALRPVRIFPTMLDIEWEVSDPEGGEVEDCKLQLASTLMWKEPDFETRPHRVSEDCWRATIARLVSQTTYDIRICGCNGAGFSDWTQGAFKTSDAPAEPFNCRCKTRHADNLLIEWHVADPEGAPVTSCEVEILGMMSYASAKFTWEGKPARVEGDLWQADVAELVSSTFYDMRIRALNDAGVGPWARLEHIKSSDMPDAPYSIKTILQEPESISIEWLVDDPEGAEVTSCEMQVATSLSWADAKGGQTQRVEDTVWRGVIAGLVPNTAYCVRVRAKNAAGDGLWKQQQVQTCHSPLPPHSIRFSSPLPGVVSLNWQVVDWKYCSVDRCEIEVGGTVTWFPAVFNEDMEPQRVRDHLWSARVSNAAPGTACTLRIRAGNKAGFSGWSTTEVLALGAPAAPLYIECVDWTMEKMTLTWQVGSDKDELFGYDVEVGEGLFWGEPVYDDEDAAPRQIEAGKWQATLSNVSPSIAQCIHIRGKNSAGPGRWCETKNYTIESELDKTPGYCCIRA